jgi:hypothetical protein
MLRLAAIIAALIACVVVALGWATQGTAFRR